MTTTGWVVLGLANLPLYFIFGRLLFKGWEDFWSAVGFWLTPDVFSLFAGEFWEDQWQQLKLGLWIAACVACVLGEGHLIGQGIGG